MASILESLHVEAFVLTCEAEANVLTYESAKSKPLQVLSIPLILSIFPFLIVISVSPQTLIIPFCLFHWFKLTYWSFRFQSNLARVALGNQIFISYLLLSFKAKYENFEFLQEFFSFREELRPLHAVAKGNYTQIYCLNSF